MHLLVGIDGSADSLDALSTTVDRARETGDDITVAVLVDADDAAGVDLDASVDEALDGFEAAIENLSGHPAGALVERAEAGPFDRLVVAGGTRSPLGKIEFDEFTEFVLLNATTTLTLVR